ncbi:hypothetical protein, partial [Microbulbifer elongatus]|uniref:hypothetical protein n=1 Tax=Microbulbifer elongatus TaxID=86173 RepID=UPI001F4BA73C
AEAICIDPSLRKHPHILLDRIFKQLSVAPGPHCGTRILHIQSAEASAFADFFEVRNRYKSTLSGTSIILWMTSRRTRIIWRQSRLASAF